MNPNTFEPGMPLGNTFFHYGIAFKFLGSITVICN